MACDRVFSSKTFLILTSFCLLFHIGYLIALLARAKVLEEYAVQETNINARVVTMRPAAMYTVYLKHFNKNHYINSEKIRRFNIFKKSLKELSRLNRQKGVNYGVTKFSDMSDDELFPRQSRPEPRQCKPDYKFCMDHYVQKIYRWDTIYCKGFSLDSAPPRRVDWRKSEVVGPVLDQKQCKSSWAFSIAGVMESMAIIQNYEYSMTRRSIQELMDCSEGSGCQERHVADALDWLCRKRWGVVTEMEYPLRLQNDTCQLNMNIEGRRIQQYFVLCNVKEEDILRLLACHGPVMAVVNVQPWKNYVDGIIQTNCVRGDPSTDQVVQIVGYDLTGDVPYYIIRNSWGEDFGIGGYVKLKYGGNLCGIADEISVIEVY